MDIYQCLGCGERWGHNSEAAIAMAEEHRSQGHQVVVGEIDRLARMWAERRPVEEPLQVPDTRRPHIVPGGRVDQCGLHENVITTAMRTIEPPPQLEPVTVSPATNGAVHVEHEDCPPPAAPAPHTTSPGLFIVREFKAWLVSEENALGFEQEVGHYLSAQAWRRLAAMIDEVAR